MMKYVLKTVQWKHSRRTGYVKEARRGQKTCQCSSQKRGTPYPRSQGGFVCYLIDKYLYHFLWSQIRGKLLMAPVFEGDNVVSNGVISGMPRKTGKGLLRNWLFHSLISSADQQIIWQSSDISKWSAVIAQLICTTRLIIFNQQSTFHMVGYFQQTIQYSITSSHPPKYYIFFVTQITIIHLYCRR